MEKTFKSKVTRGGSALRPDVITITDNNMVYTKRNSNLIGKDEKTILIEDIVEISIDTHLIGADLIVRTKGLGRIKIESFDKNDIKEIKNIIEKIQKRLKSSNAIQKQPTIIKEKKSKEAELEELRLKNEKDKRKEEEQKYQITEKIPFITFSENDVIEKLQKLLLNYKIKASSRINSFNIERTKVLFDTYESKIKEGLRFSKKYDIDNEETEHLENELKEIRQIANNNIDKLNVADNISENSKNENSKTNLSNVKTKKFLKFGIIGLVLLVLLIMIFKPKKVEIKKYSPVNVTLLTNEISGNVSNYINVKNETYSLTVGNSKDKISIPIKVKKKYKKKISSYSFDATIQFFDKDTVLIPLLTDFKIEYNSKEKLIQLLQEGNGKILTTFEGFISSENREALSEKSKYFKINITNKK